MTVHALLAMLADPQPAREQLTHAAQIRQKMLLVIVWGMAFYAVVALAFWVAWDTSTWVVVWGALVGGGVALPIAWLALATRHRERRQLLLRPLLLEVLAHADERLMPLIAIQPMPVNLNSADEQFGPLVSFFIQDRKAKRNQAVILTSMLFLPLIIILIDLAYLFVSPSLGMIGRTIMITTGIGLYIELIPLIIWRIRRTTIPQRLSVTTNGSGVSWQFGPKGPSQHIDWSQARALLHVTVASGSTRTSSSNYYALIGSDAALVWFDSKVARADTFAYSERLLSVITAHTQLPLRDASQFAQMLSGADGAMQRLLTHYGLTPYLSPELVRGLQTVPAAPHRVGRVMGIAAILVWVAIPFAAGGWVQSYNSAYFGSLPQGIAAEPPLFSTALAYDDGSLPASPGSAFTHGVYEIHDPDNTQPQLNLFPQHTFGSAAYSVTASESGAVPDSADDGIGLVFHASPDARTYLIFEVKYDGEWELLSASPQNAYGPDYLDSGFSSAINAGPAATNHLLIITNNQSMFLYVNGQFIKQVQPDSYLHIDLSRTGTAGVYLNASGMTGDFTNFAVAPAPATDFWDVLLTAPPWHA